MSGDLQRAPPPPRSVAALWLAVEHIAREGYLPLRQHPGAPRLEAQIRAADRATP